MIIKMTNLKNVTTILSLTLLSITLFSSPSHQQSYYPNPNPNPRLEKAYIALQAWKHAMTSDPKGTTNDWHGPHVCNYTGVFCAPAPDASNLTTVAGIDLNHANISGYLPDHLGLLADLSLFHVNSNRFCGSIPATFANLTILHELDVSNNDLTGKFPQVLLKLQSLKFLDIRFNGFHGDVPSDLFDMSLDALFINSNKFRSLPSNFLSSPVSVAVFANNNLKKFCFDPSGFKKMADTAREVIFMNAGLTGCLPPEVGLLKHATVFDVSDNELVGALPESIGKMRKLEHLNVANNKLSGDVPASICKLPNLENFTYSGNYLYGEPAACLKLTDRDDRRNCIPHRPRQRSEKQCVSFYNANKVVDCASYGCKPTSRPSPPPPAHYPAPAHHYYP